MNTPSFTKTTLVGFALGFVLIGGVALVITLLPKDNTTSKRQNATTPTITQIPTHTVTPIPSKTPALTPSLNPTQTSTAPITTKLVHDAPFLSQAPSAKWSDPIFQDGCEEASIIMATKWKEGVTSISATEGEQLIRDISNYEIAQGGSARDTSTADTAKLMEDYFSVSGEVQYDITAEDIKQELQKGNILILPINGQKIGNPYFTPPGPLFHMLVVIGYDPATKSFITNDPGTRFGAKFSYNETTLMNAVRDYNTGYHEPVTQERTAMIIVTK